MSVKFICHFRGCEQLSASDFIRLARQAGYDGGEVNIPFGNTYAHTIMEAAEANDM